MTLVNIVTAIIILESLLFRTSEIVVLNNELLDISLYSNNLLVEY